MTILGLEVVQLFLISICCFCRHAYESSTHLFFHCPITSSLWDWLSKGSEQVLDLSNCLNLLLSVKGKGSKMVQQVLASAIVHIIWAIWMERNSRYFNNQNKSMLSLTHNIISEVALSFKLVIAQGSTSMTDFKLSQLFGIPFKLGRVVPVQDVHWIYPSLGCVKINCDGSSVGSHPCGSIGIVYRSASLFLGAFSQNIGYAYALEAEFCACMMAIERASEMCLADIWLETDSLIVCKALSDQVGIPWRMHNRWQNVRVWPFVIDECNEIIVK
jgi:hypothetical protein